MAETREHRLRALIGDLREQRLREREGEPLGDAAAEATAEAAHALGFGRAPETRAALEAVVDRLYRDGSSEDALVQLLSAGLDSPAPETTLVNLHRFIEQVGEPGVFLSTVSQAPPIVDMISTVFGSSQYMADILIRNPGLLYWLMEKPAWETPDGADAYTTFLREEASRFQTLEGQLNAVRRSQRQILLGIGVRDLMGQASVEQTTAALSHLAEAITVAVMEILTNEFARGRNLSGYNGIAVIAMGKLGGGELNYSSDIDLLYACEDVGDEEMAFYLKLARRFTEALSEVTQEGYLYRVDLRLRPDGKAGPLVNTETAMRLYYENRGRPWEFQAMLKARVIAGNRELGARILSSMQKLVHSSSLSYSPLDDISRMRGQIKEHISAHERSFNIKLMEGGIRDVEFIVQTLQLMHGHSDDTLRTTNTLAALAAVRAAGKLEAYEEENLAAAYRFFRLVEHRIQMMHQFKTHTVPSTPKEIALLAARAARGPLGNFTTDTFLETLSKHLGNVRTISDSFFAGETVHPHAVLLMLPENDERAARIIGQYGIENVGAAMRTLHGMAYGSFPHLLDRSVRKTFEPLLPLLLEGVAASGNPEKTLVNVGKIADAARMHSALYRIMVDSEPARDRIVGIAAMSDLLTNRLCNQADSVAPLCTDPAGVMRALEEPLVEFEQFESESAKADNDRARERIARQRNRMDRCRLASFALDIEAQRGISHMPAAVTAEAHKLIADAFETAMGGAGDFAVFSLGSFAVGEPRPLSDVDLIIVTDDADIPEATRRAQLVNRWFTDGGILKLDFRLRGEGASAPLIQDLSFYNAYAQGRISPWERIALTKLAYWCGDDGVASKFIEIVDRSMSKPFSEAQVASLLDTRKSVERLAPKSFSEWETKRSAGGRYDIEYMCGVGLAQSDGRHPGYATPTPQRLEELVKRGLLSADARKLLEVALRTFTLVEYLMELQQITSPHTDGKSMWLDSYLQKSFEMLGVSPDGSVRDLLRVTKAHVRMCYDPFMAQFQ